MLVSNDVKQMPQAFMKPYIEAQAVDSNMIDDPEVKCSQFIFIRIYNKHISLFERVVTSQWMMIQVQKHPDLRRLYHFRNGTQ